ncbi:MAG: hypothetical protein Fur0014_03510 [Rubrivivax sp.]
MPVIARQAVHPLTARQRGVASLVIVALLFFVMSLVAAYTNRNLIFEQRTSANQYRSTMALEAAEAGVEWAISLLNAGSIDDSCNPSADPGDTTFRERYLEIDPETGLITAVAPDANARGTAFPSCVFDGTDWSCSCPAEGTAAPAAPAGTGPFPAFQVRLSRASATHPGLVLVEVNGCTRLSADCLNFPPTSVPGEGRASVSVLVALRSALPALPAAALTVRGGIDVGAAALGAYNTSPLGSGITIQAGGDIGASTRAALRLGTVDGSPGETSLRTNDPVLGGAGMTAERLFQTTFAADPLRFEEQPGLRRLVECDGTCTADTIRAVAALNRGRILWVDGDVDFDTAGDVGSADQPLMLVATGSITFSSPVTFHGVLYSRAEDWATSGAGEVRGAVIAEGSLSGTGSHTIVHELELLRRLQWRTGSFVRVPGGWADFRDVE